MPTSMINTILTVLQVSFAVLLIISILLQARGTGLGASFGGEGNIYRTKRGIEKKLFQASIVFVTLFIGISIANLLF